MVSGVGDLTIAHPHDRLAGSTVGDRPAQGRPVHAVTDVAARDIADDTTSIGEHPRVRRRAAIAGPMAVANDERVGGAMSQCGERLAV